MAGNNIAHCSLLASINYAQAAARAQCMKYDMFVGGVRIARLVLIVY